MRFPGRKNIKQERDLKMEQQYTNCYGCKEKQSAAVSALKDTAQLPGDKNQEALFRVHLSENRIYATPITGDSPVKTLTGKYYFVPSRPFVLRAGLLVSIRDPSVTKPFLPELICSPKDFAHRQECTYVEIDGQYYEILQKKKSNELYRPYGDMQQILNGAVKTAINTYHTYAELGGCCIFLTLTVKREHYGKKNLEKGFSFLRNRLNSFRKGMNYHKNNLRPDGEIYFIERYYSSEPKFHVHAYFFYNTQHNEKEIRKMIKRYWHLGRISVKQVDSPAVLSYPSVSIPKKYEKLQDAVSWLWANRPDEQGAIRFLNSRLRLYPNNKQIQILRRKVFSAMFFPKGKTPISVYGDVFSPHAEKKLTLDQLEEIIDPETFTAETVPITDKRTGRIVASIPCIRGKMKNREDT